MLFYHLKSCHFPQGFTRHLCIHSTPPPLHAGMWNVTTWPTLSEYDLWPASLNVTIMRKVTGSRDVRGGGQLCLWGRGVDWRLRHTALVQEKGTSIYLRGHKRSTAGTHTGSAHGN
ncbi:hypothetical protein L798_15107 [Zootermopsis nevadensis]|uniref:Uncharacterized protein n=1 Tax=Zootermopsis nevadensis TaxID=136037 RepID=A0A067QY62_ZOONE|nr:hypothetical protein L798_15107 [Zootermopsis nevadensis]